MSLFSGVLFSSALQYRDSMISTNGDMFAACAIAIFCLVSVSRSAPLTCEDSVRPLDQLDPRHLEGRWALVAGSLSNPANLEFFKSRDSSSINFSNTSATSSFVYTPSIHVGGKCHFESYIVSLENGVLAFDVRDQVNLTVTFLHTSCQDCVVMRFDNKLKELQRLYLFSKRREVGQEEMDEFKAQLECLNMPLPVVMDSKKELCAEQSALNSAVAQSVEQQH